jgi:hypothetical protein
MKVELLCASIKAIGVLDSTELDQINNDRAKYADEPMTFEEFLALKSRQRGFVHLDDEGEPLAIAAANVECVKVLDVGSKEAAND